MTPLRRRQQKYDPYGSHLKNAHPVTVQIKSLMFWPYPETRLRKANLSIGPSLWGNLHDAIYGCMRRLKAYEGVVELVIAEHSIPIKGWPQKQAKVLHPGTALSFNSKYGPLRFTCDRFAAWSLNLRAIYLTLEALQAASDCSGLANGEQYRGWIVQPKPPTPMSLSDAVFTLFGRVETIPLAPTIDTIEAAYQRRKHLCRGDLVLLERAAIAKQVVADYISPPSAGAQARTITPGESHAER